MEKTVKLYVDSPVWEKDIKVDDFIVAIGKKQSNSVYHVAEVSKKQSPKHKRMTRYHLKCFKCDLITALSRDKDQNLLPMIWYSRNNNN